MAFMKWKDPRRKPPCGAIIDYNNPITRGLVGCWLFNEINSKISWGAQLENSSWVGDFVTTNADDGKIIPSKDIIIKHEITIEVKFLYKNTPAIYYETFIAKGDSSYRLSRQGGEDHLHFSLSGTSNPACNEVGQTLFYNKKYHCFGIYDGTKSKIVNNNIITREQSNSGVINVSSYPLWLLNNSQKQDRGCKFLVEFIRLWGRALSENEYKQLYYEPYSFFLIPVPRTYIVMGGGGGIVDVATTEEAGFGDTVEGNLSTTQEITETIGLNDTIANTIDTTQSITETIGVNDTVTSTIDTTQSITEAIGLNDTYEATTTSASTGEVTETIGLNDTVANTIDTTQSITETIGLNDTYEATVTSASTGEVTEAIGISDDVSVVLEAEGILSEGTGFSDDYQATVTGEETGILTEGVGFGDSFEATAEIGASITESIGINDTVEGSGIYNVGITEGIGLNDSVGVALDTDITKTFTGNSQTQRSITLYNRTQRAIHLNSKIRRS